MRKIFLIFMLIFIGVTVSKVVSSFTSGTEEDLIYKNISQLKNEEDFTFVVLRDNKNSISTFGRIIKLINKDSKIDFVIDTGDMVFDGSLVKYHFFLKQMKKLNKPFLPVPGNHDMEDHGMENYIRIFGPLYYSFHVGSFYFIILNNLDEKRVDPYQMKWLEEELAKSQNCRYRFVFMHVPIFDPRVLRQLGHSMKDVKNAKELASILKKYNVTMVFAGHIHGYFEGEWFEVPFIVSGGAGAELMRLDPNHYFYHFVKVHVSESSVDYELVKLKSPDFNVIDRIEAFVWLYTYSFIVINYWIILLVISLFILISMIVYGTERKFLLEMIKHVGNWRLVRFARKVSEKAGRSLEKK